MLKNIVISNILCTVVILFTIFILYDEERGVYTGQIKPDPVVTMPLLFAKENVAGVIGLTPDGETLFSNTGTGKFIQPCSRNKEGYAKNNISCDANLVNPSQQVLDLIDQSANTHKIQVIKNGQKTVAVLNSIVVISFPTPELGSSNKKKSDSLTFLDSIISSASAQATVTQYCTTIFSGGTERQTCISEGNSCIIWGAAYGEKLVASIVPQCAQYY